MQTVINLTPHAVRVINKDGAEIAVFPASGEIARVSQVRTLHDKICGVPMGNTTSGETTGLPDQKDGVWLLVSAMVRMALPHRLDLLSPGELVRDAKGNVVGCLGFDCN